MKRIVHIVGARPNYIKASPVVNTIDFAEQIVLNTGQHYDRNLSSDIAESLNKLTADINLNDGSNKFKNEFHRFSFLTEKIYKNLNNLKPNLVVVYGDVDSTLAAALVSSRMGIPIAHVESGLRSGDNRMPEELNRKMVDTLASLHFATEDDGVKNLKREGFSNSIKFVGNSMIDSLKLMLQSDIYKNSKYDNTNAILLTCHRPLNVDNRASLEKVYDMCSTIDKKIAWPVHPRSMNSLKKFNLLEKFMRIKNLTLLGPLNYCDFVKMMNTSTVVVTDSGGVQEETTYLKVPCLTIRENTERPSTINVGTNTLIAIEDAPKMIENIYNNDYKNSTIPDLWDGEASKRISNSIFKFFEAQHRGKN
jgi:UDP-N-acetylglucosamine 2-epimerase (non-hydrolysing)